MDENKLIGKCNKSIRDPNRTIKTASAQSFKAQLEAAFGKKEIHTGSEI